MILLRRVPGTRDAAMLKRYSQLFLSLLVVCDLTVVAGAWLLAFWLRFFSPLVTDAIPIRYGIPELERYTKLLVVVVPIFYALFRSHGLYLPHRIARRSRELFNLLRASALAVGSLIVVDSMFREFFQASRVVFAIFLPLEILGVAALRSVIRAVLRQLRKRGQNLRHVVVVGAGSLGSEVVERILRHPEMGLHIVGVLGKDASKVGLEIHGIPVTGIYEDVTRMLRGGGIDQVIVAIPMESHHRLAAILDAIGSFMVDIKVVPDLYRFISLRGGIEDFDGIPVVSILETPLYGWNRLLKRAFDIVVSSLVLVFAAPLMLLIALAVRISSPGPIFYRQERMGLDGQTFRMYKFRTMRVDAEAETGPVWASEDDPRRTSFGGWLRRWSLDELPQLFNVLRGQMSLVGPRPERPVFIQSFKDQIPKYMLRHRMQAGVTGWAQVNGWRGNTSLEQRIACDLYYIENWSLSFDLRILGLTFIKGLRHKNAY